MPKYTLERFQLRYWSKINKNGSIPAHCPELGNCWERTPKVREPPYGMMTFNGKSTAMHRISWILAYGEIPDGLWVLHKCDNRLCVRPDHLWLGTPKDNTQDMMRKGRHKKAYTVSSRNRIGG